MHSFHDAHTVPFCLTADHIATCHMSLCSHQASTVLVCFWTCVVWKVFGTCDDGTLVALVESHESLGSWTQFWPGGMISHYVESHEKLDKMQRVQWWTFLAWCNVSCQFVESHERSRSTEVSVLISRRLRRMVSVVSEVFGKHFGGLYSWSTMCSSFVSPSVASLSQCESFHCSCICMAQDPCDMVAELTLIW